MTRAIVQMLKPIMHLYKIGEPKLANKILKSIKKSQTLHFTSKERDSFNIIKRDLITASKINTNIPKQFGTKGMSLRKELFYNPRAKEGGALSPGYFTSSKRTPMIDVDFPDPKSHDILQTVVKGKGEWKELLKDFMKTKAGKKSALKIYETPAGIRTFDISKAHRGTKPYVHEGVASELGGDPFYIAYAKSKGTYDARVFPKPGRIGDFIAKPFQGAPWNRVITGSEAEISRKGWNEMLVHDALIRAILHNTTKNQKVSVGGLLSRTNLSQIKKAF
jgi:hypothetical protein